MKKSFFLLPFLSVALLNAQDNSSTDMSKALPLPIMNGMQGAQSFIMIDPKSRASDLKEAFELLKREKTGPKVILQLSDGSTISNIVDFTVATSGTLLIIKYNGMQGLKYQVINIEDISSISHM